MQTKAPREHCVCWLAAKRRWGGWKNIQMSLLNTHTHTTFGSGIRLQHVGADDWWLQKWRKMCLKVLTMAKSPSPGACDPAIQTKEQESSQQGEVVLRGRSDILHICITATSPPLQIYSAKGTPITAAKRKLIANVNLRNCWSTCCTPPKY